MGNRHRARRAGVARAATNGERKAVDGRGLGRIGAECGIFADQRDPDVDRGVAAALADRLGENAVAALAIGLDDSEVANGYCAGIARRGAIAADLDQPCIAGLVGQRRTLSEGQVGAGIAAAPADRLRDQPGRAETEGVDQRGTGGAVGKIAAIERHGPGVAANPAAAADGDRQRIALGGIDADDVKAADTAAAADRLRRNACR